MKKKFFDRSALQQLAASNKPRLSHTTDRLRHALIGHRLLEISGGSETLALGWWYRFEQFLDDVPPPHDRQVAPLTVFQPDLDRRWSAAIVVCCSAFAIKPKPDEPNVESFLSGLGITYLHTTAGDVDKGYLKTPDFKSRVHRALLANRYGSTTRTSQTRSSFISDQEGFSLEPRPIYPPRSRFLRD